MRTISIIHSWKRRNNSLNSILFDLVGAIGTAINTVFGSRVRFSCPEGQVFATGVEVIDTTCMPGGEWSQSYIPKCQEVSKNVELHA